MPGETPRPDSPGSHVRRALAFGLGLQQALEAASVPERDAANLLLGACALALAIAPGSVPLLVATLSAVLVDLSVRMPDAAVNHDYLAALVAIALLGELALERWRRARASGGPSDWDTAVMRALPTVRGLVLVMYGFALLHKLNTAYLNPDSSCAVYVWNQRLTPVNPLLWRVDSIGGKQLLVSASLLSEALVPLLLALPPTRALGVVSGTLLHALLGHAAFPFSSLMYALYVAFVPGAAAEVTARLRDGLLRVQALAPALLRGGYAVLVTSLLAYELSRYDRTQTLAPRIWLLSVAAPAVALAVWSALQPRAPNTSSRALPSLLGSACIALALVNGAAPYLGLKTRTAFNMYSNLTTEGGRTNHLFVPTRLQMFDYQRDLVRIRASGDPQLAHFTATGEQLVFISFRRLVERRAAERGEFTLDYFRSGKLYTLSATPSVHVLGRESWFERHFLAFRSVTPRAECRW
jgi:hypothetical protein